MLVMFHFSEGHDYRDFWPLDFVATRGYLWVEFFFCLSGFILTHVYGARLAQLFTARGYGAFLQGAADPALSAASVHAADGAAGRHRDARPGRASGITPRSSISPITRMITP